MANKAILIDPKKGTVEYITVTDYRSIQHALGVDMFTCVRLGNGETLYVDDEGLINGTNFGFNIDHQFSEMGVLMGRGLILGTNSQGGSEDTKLSPLDLAKNYGITGTFCPVDNRN